MSEFNRATGREGLRRVCRQSGRFELGQTCVEHSVNAAEEIHQPFGSGRPQTRSESERQPRDLVRVDADRRSR